MERTPNILAIGFALLGLAVSGTAMQAAADIEIILGPGNSFEMTMHADSMAYVNYNWTVVPADSDIHFVVLDPDGAALVNTTASSSDSFLLSLDSGDYTFNWTNLESSTVTLNYNVISQSTGIDDEEQILDTIFLGFLVSAVVVVIIIVLVIVVVMGGSKKTQPPIKGTPAQLAPPGEAPSPFVPRICPRCGSPFDSQHTFCPKCGHRVR